jgi:hypothetical protein
MELLTTVGEQIGCLLALARLAPATVEQASHVELVRQDGRVGTRVESQDAVEESES